MLKGKRVLKYCLIDCLENVAPYPISLRIYGNSKIGFCLKEKDKIFSQIVFHGNLTSH